MKPCYVCETETTAFVNLRPYGDTHNANNSMPLCRPCADRFNVQYRYYEPQVERRSFEDEELAKYLAGRPLAL